MGPCVRRKRKHYASARAASRNFRRVAVFFCSSLRSHQSQLKSRPRRFHFRCPLFFWLPSPGPLPIEVALPLGLGRYFGKSSRAGRHCLHRTINASSIPGRHLRLDRHPYPFPLRELLCPAQAHSPCRVRIIDTSLSLSRTSRRSSVESEA